MDIQKIQERFEDLMLANPDFDEGLLEKDEEDCYVDSNIADMYSMFEAGIEVGEAWQAAKASVVPDGFVLVPKEPTFKMARAYQMNSVAPVSSLSVSGYKAIVEAQEPSHD